MTTRHMVAAVLMGVAALHGASMRAASFDCTRAKSPMERVICSDKDLSDADSAMSAAYRSALGQLPPDSVSKLRVDQLRWLQWLQTACGVSGRPDPATSTDKRPRRGRGSETAPLALATCMKEPYRSRTEVLKHAVARVDGVLFLTRSMYLLQPNSTDDTTGSPQFKDFGELEASWPEAQTNDPAWAAWNAGVLRVGSPDDRQPQDWDASMAEEVDASETLGLPKVRNGRAHMDISYEAMGHGAAHPNESFTKLTWLLAEKRALRPSDVFQPGTAWERALAHECWRQLKSGDNAASLYGTVKGPEDKTVLQVVANPSNWTITPEGLSISWPEYSVTPRAAPQDDTVVPWNLLQKYLVAGFQP